MWNVILNNFGYNLYCQIFECMSIFVIFECFWTNFYMFEVTDVIVTFLNQWKFLADVF